MKILILCANSKIGQLITNEALKANYEVTCMARKPSSITIDHPKVNFIQKNVFDLDKNDVKDYDVVISCFGTLDKNEFDKFSTLANLLIKLLEKTDKRLFIIGGAGSLYVDETKKTKLLDTSEFPKELYGLAYAHSLAFDIYRNANNINWTYFSPAALFDYEGNSTSYELTGDLITLNNQNQSYLTYSDAAKIIIDEIKNKNFIKKRFSAISNK